MRKRDRPLLLVLVCVLAGCSAGVSRVVDPAAAARIAAYWQGAEPLSVAIERLNGMIEPGHLPGIGRPGTLLLSAAFWPKELARFPGLPSWIEGTTTSRGTSMLPRPLIADMRVSQGRATHSLLPSTACRWLVYAAIDEAWAPKPDGAALEIGDLPNATRLRAVFRFAPEPRPLKSFRHGDALEVTSWGLGLHLLAAELRDASDRPLRHWFQGG